MDDNSLYVKPTNLLKKIKVIYYFLHKSKKDYYLLLKIFTKNKENF